jgi:hypothetical protein
VKWKWNLFRSLGLQPTLHFGTLVGAVVVHQMRVLVGRKILFEMIENPLGGQERGCRIARGTVFLACCFSPVHEPRVSGRHFPPTARPVVCISKIVNVSSPVVWVRTVGELVARPSAVLQAERRPLRSLYRYKVSNAHKLRWSLLNLMTIPLLTLASQRTTGYSPIRHSSWPAKRCPHCRAGT